MVASLGDQRRNTLNVPWCAVLFGGQTSSGIVQYTWRITWLPLNPEKKHIVGNVRLMPLPQKHMKCTWYINVHHSCHGFLISRGVGNGGHAFCMVLASLLASQALIGFQSLHKQLVPGEDCARHCTSRWNWKCTVMHSDVSWPILSRIYIYILSILLKCQWNRVSDKAGSSFFEETKLHELVKQKTLHTGMIRIQTKDKSSQFTLL